MKRCDVNSHRSIEVELLDDVSNAEIYCEINKCILSDDVANEQSDVESLAVVETMKKYWPCAPDGFIPNSVIRRLIQPRPPPDYSQIIKELDEKELENRVRKGIHEGKFNLQLKYP